MKCVLLLCTAIALVAVARSPQLAAAADLRTGKQTYDAYCASCHGLSGNGEGPSAKWVKPLPRDFTQCKLMAMYKDADLLKAIKDGGPAAFVSYSMPPWRAILTDEQIDDVLAYERSFCVRNRPRKCLSTFSRRVFHGIVAFLRNSETRRRRDCF